MPRMTWMISIAVTGFVLTLAGFLYGVLTVGVPYPDPTPAQAAAERSNLAISDWAMAGGGIMLLAGIAGVGILGVTRLLWPRA